MYTTYKEHLNDILSEIKEAGLYKNERIIVSPQGAEIELDTGQRVLNFCANNYLGLSNNRQLIEAARCALESHGYGMSSVRFICGTTELHKKLESKIAEFFGTEDTILYAACFDANGGVFEPLLTDEDAIISDALNHASIIDGVRLCKAQRFRYENADMNDLEKQLKLAKDLRFRLIVTDGVFSMDGNVAPLDRIAELAGRYDAMVMVDESHSAGVVGSTGRGVTELYNLRGKIEIITGTLGKAFGGAIGQALGLVLSKLGMKDYDPFSSTQIRIIAGIAGFALLVTFLGRWTNVRGALRNSNGMKLITINTMNSPRNVMIDCIAWNLTVLFSFSTRMKIMPVKNVSTYVNADAMFSSRPNVAFSIFTLQNCSTNTFSLDALKDLVTY